jgi:UPF0755 protein
MVPRLIKGIFFGAICCLVLIAYWLFDSQPLPSTPYSFELTSGRTLKGVARDLNEQGLLHYPSLFSLLGRLSPKSSHLRAGSYVFEGPVSPFTLYVTLFMGSAQQHEVTLVEGLTLKEIRATLNDETALKHDLADLDDHALLERLKVDLPLSSDYLLPEGLFRADTYFYTGGTSDIAILERAYRLLRKDLDQAWKTRDSNLPLQTMYEALIMASIVERETAQSSERPMIAGVFINRLRSGLRLQTDPTVIYGMGERYHGKLHHQDLLDDTAWNTYTRSGLPPTPIGLVSRDALNAVLHPASTPALYFVARGNGYHQFSENLADHERAIQLYLKHNHDKTP